MKMKRILSIILALAMLFALAACGSSASPADTSSESADSAVPEEAAAPEEPPEEDEVPEEDAATGTLSIGVLEPLSGSSASYGAEQLNGIELAVHYVNDVLGGLPLDDGVTYMVELDVQDHAGDPETGVSAVERLIEDGVSGMVGPFTSAVAATVVPRAIQYGVPLVVCNATAENFMGVENKYVYRTNVGSSDGDGLTGLFIKYLNEYYADEGGLTKVAVVHSDDDWGSSAYMNWANMCEQNNIELVANEAVSESSTDLSTVVNKIKSNGAQLVICACWTASTNLLVSQMDEYEVDAFILGLGGGVGETDFIANCGDSCEGVLYTSTWLPMYGGMNDLGQELYDYYVDTYGMEMSMYACWGFLATATLLTAIEKAGTTDREAIADALYDMDLTAGEDWALCLSGYDGVSFCTEGEANEQYTSESGERYNQNNKLGDTGGMIVVQVQDAEWTTIFPLEKTASGSDCIIEP